MYILHIVNLPMTRRLLVDGIDIRLVRCLKVLVVVHGPSRGAEVILFSEFVIFSKWRWQWITKNCLQYQQAAL